MIKSFKHKGLEKLFNENDKRGVNPVHSPKLLRILDRLDASTNSQDMNLPGYKLHELKGADKGFWSVWVNGNWRVTFKFEGTDATHVDYVDYH
jgi:proteic killer suppression protein